ncbi:MAG: response regulator [Candidatus Omnitrophica bacterium]|nr:response regulator [Candidatus Omnitrophota bacterium]MDD5311256.1 response regulator [Candidatus Omnitrophota bacterium]MDD5546963.1 response regulator [Candidatus Omnitrophota bacterium]
MAKILMIDDDAMVLKLYSEILSKEGFEVLTSSDAKEGFDMAVSQSPSLVLLDIMMPTVDGTRVHEALSQNDKTKDIPVVFLTALVREEEVAASGWKIGGLDYISKSTPKDKFIARVKDILAGKK